MSAGPRRAPVLAMANQIELRVVRTTVLDLAFEDRGPRDGLPVVLAHGWPDSVRTWDRVVPALVAAGYRTIAYHQRGAGATRFRQRTTLHSGEIGALANDLLELTQALGCARFAVIGHGAGADAAFVAAALAPARMAALVALSPGYPLGVNEDLAPEQLAPRWHEWFFAMPQASALLRRQRAWFAQTLWQTWSPGWRFDAEDFGGAALAFDNPTWVEVTLHHFRHRWRLAPGDGRYRDIDAAIAARPGIAVPTLGLRGADDRCPAPGLPAASLRGPSASLVLPGVGHFPQRQAPTHVAREVLAWLRAHGYHTDTATRAPTVH